MDTPLAEKSPDTSLTPEFRRNLNNSSGRSQAFCLNTTVPINIVGSDIGGRHTPTKQALRHSRMIAMNKTGKKGAYIRIKYNWVFFVSGYGMPENHVVLTIPTYNYG